MGTAETSGQRVRKRREALSLSRDDLHLLSGVPKSTIIKIETDRTGNPHPSTKRAIATALGWNPASYDTPELADPTPGIDGRLAERVAELERWRARVDTVLADLQTGEPVTPETAARLAAALAATNDHQP